MDNPELIENYDAKLARLLTQAHHDGLSLEAIIFLLDQKLGNLKVIDYASSYLDCNAPESVRKGIETTSVID